MIGLFIILDFGMGIDSSTVMDMFWVISGLGGGASALPMESAPPTEPTSAVGNRGLAGSFVPQALSPIRAKPAAANTAAPNHLPQDLGTGDVVVGWAGVCLA